VTQANAGDEIRAREGVEGAALGPGSWETVTSERAPRSERAGGSGGAKPAGDA
jgi:hypothetical protein